MVSLFFLIPEEVQGIINILIFLSLHEMGVLYNLIWLVVLFQGEISAVEKSHLSSHVFVNSSNSFQKTLAQEKERNRSAERHLLIERLVKPCKSVHKVKLFFRKLTENSFKTIQISGCNYFFLAESITNLLEMLFPYHVFW